MFKLGLCLKFVPIARPSNSMVKQCECVAPQEKLNILYWLPPPEPLKTFLTGTTSESKRFFITNQRI